MIGPLATRFGHDQRGAVSAEFVLTLPIMFALMFGGIEAGHFAWTQHRLVNAVREGARFAGRLPVDRFCAGADAALDADAEGEIKAVTLTGQLPNDDGEAVGLAAIPGLTAADVVVEADCAAFAGDGDAGTGIYSDLGNGGPIVTIRIASVRYPSMMDAMGLIDTDLRMTARASAPVIGL